MASNLILQDPKNMAPPPTEDASGQPMPDPMQAVAMAMAMAGLTDQDDGYDETLEEKLQSFGAKMSTKRDEWINFRVTLGVDHRWREDLEQYEGRDPSADMAANMMKSVEQGFPITTATNIPATRSTIVVNQTRTKSDGAEARLCDIVIPTDDRNWACEPTTLPMLARDLQSSEAAVHPTTGAPIQGPQVDEDGNKVIGPDGQPVMIQYTKKQLAQAIQQMAWRSAEAMQDVIDDQLSTCNFEAETRKVIHNAVVLGTGVMRGPVVTGRTRRAWTPMSDPSGQSTWVQSVVQVNGPASWSVDPFNVWFDPGCGTDIHAGQGVIEVEDMTPRRVRDLAKQPHFMRAQIARVLREGPQRKRAPDTQNSVDKKGTLRVPNFEVWTYTGEVDIDDLRAVGAPGLPPEDSDDAELTTMSAIVVMINNTVVKVVLNPLEDGSLPYDVLNWARSRETPYGYGVPYLMRSPAKIMTSAWRAMMDNAGICAGPHIILNKNAIKPQDGKYTITPRKIWLAENDIQDVTKAFTSVNFDSHQEELSAIIAMAEQLADKDTGAPDLNGPNGSTGASGAVDTVGGMAMKMNSESIVLRRIVKQVDDDLIEPHVKRYYDYNMAYGEDEDTKGDFDVKARGSSALLIRDIQNQAYIQLLPQVTQGVLSMYVDDEKFSKKVIQAFRIPTADVWRAQADIDARKKAAQENPQEDPRIATARIMAEARTTQTQAVQHSREVESQSRVQLEQEREQFNAEQAQAQRDHDMALAQLAYQTAVLTLASKEHLTVQQINAQMAEVALTQRNENARFQTDVQLKKAQGSGVVAGAVRAGGEQTPKQIEQPGGPQ